MIELEEFFVCRDCGKPSVKIGGFISRKSDRVQPQPLGFGCNCDRAMFISIEDLCSDYTEVLFGRPPKNELN